MTSLNPGPRDEGAMLYRIFTIRDEIVIGMTPEEIEELGAPGAEAVSAIGRVLSGNAPLTAWQFAVRKGADGALEYAPHRRVSIFGHESLRIESFETSLRIISQEQ